MIACGIQAVIFDLGRVLLDFDHTIAARKIASFTTKSADEIFNLFFDSALTRSFEEGKISPQDFFYCVKEILNLAITYEQFVPMWNQIFFFTQENRAVYNIAESLRKHYRIAILSNINLLHFEYIRNEFPIFGTFHDFIKSYEMKVTKPDPLIYKEALRIMKVEAANTFYTDDRPELVASARNVGMQAFVFNSAEQLKDDLKKTGVQIS